MSCIALKITRWPIFIPRCITSAFCGHIYTFGLSLAFVMPSLAFKDLLACHFFVDCLSWDGTYPHNFNDKNENNKIKFISHLASAVRIPSSVNNFWVISCWVTYYQEVY